MSRKGFTLIELLVVVAILALLASIVFSNLSGAREGARISNALSFQSQTHSLLGSDLVGWWNFNDSGDRYKDLSGYGNDGSCSSCPAPVDGAPGTLGNAMEFDGVGDYVQKLSPVNLPVGSEPRTIAVWVKPSIGSSGSIRSMVAYGTSSEYENFMFALNNSNQLYLYGHFGGDTSSGTSITEGVFSYVIITYDGTSARFYKDGELKSGPTEKPYNTVINASRGLTIGSQGSTSYFFNGLIDDVRIYSRALTASEVQGLYAQTKGNYVVK